MSPQTILAILGSVVGLAIVGAGLWGIVQVSSKDVMTKRLQTDNAYLREQLDFIEPRFRDAEAKNEMLMRLHNPTALLTQMTKQQRRNHEQTIRLLEQQHQMLSEINEKVRDD